MCTAQLLLVSDVMRPSYNLSTRPHGGVCRRLFADEHCDRPSLYTALQSKLEEQHRRQSERWNFDFRTETPLSGRYQWVRLGTQQRVPSNGSRVVAEVRTATQEQRPSTSSRKPLSTTQSKITDFLQFRKRSSQSFSSSSKCKSARMDIRRTSATTTLPERTVAS